METVIGLVLLVFLIFMIITMGLLLLVIFKIKRVLTTALTFVFTVSLKPRWMRL